MGMDTAEVKRIGGGLASKVTNIDGIRGILRKSGNQTTNEKGEEHVADLSGITHKEETTYAQTLKSEVPSVKGKKSKVEWLAEGDNNTAFFHNSLKSRNHRSRIDVIMDGGGIIYEGENVHKAFVKHYENFLGVKGDISLTPTPELFQNRLESGVANSMVRPISDEEEEGTA
ncbi:hypothetical protein QVD17_19733 [Tagetes erecta]|uniref:Uncharacterized protein n=1 Tax=Tagetes erecta TaxID=13708 RepID=A0AAD8KKG0_TARER|nr:hypothetical protein QVD17_19733 [Tagetes erecta]